MRYDSTTKHVVLTVGTTREIEILHPTKHIKTMKKSRMNNGRRNYRNGCESMEHTLCGERFGGGVSSQVTT